MALISDSYLIDILGIFTALIISFTTWVYWIQTYWKRKGLAAPAPTFLFGNTKGVFLQTETFSDFSVRIYEYFRDRNLTHGGFYFMCSPQYMTIDPEIVKHVMQNDFSHFVDRGLYVDEEHDPLTAHLFSLGGAKWRNLRAKLTPTFTSGKMKMMFETLVKCSDQLIVELDKEVGVEPVNIKDILVRFTTDIIGNCAFGIECNSLKDPDNEFCKRGKLFFEDSLWEHIIGILAFIFPNIMRKIGVRIINPELSDFFTKIVKDNIEYREKNNVHRKDFMHLLIQLKNRGKLDNDGGILKEENDGEDKPYLTFNEIAAQSFVFFLAGFETSSTTMTFCLFELASNPDIQKKVRQEINEVLKKHDGKLTYDAIMEMNYMEKVINETLRKYPPLPTLNRVVTKEYKLPGTDIILEEGTKVLIPVLGLQRDEKYYPNPEKFDPERFTEENKKSRHPYTFLPFGEGPRICIGLRFGMMQTKVGLSVLLKNYRFSLNPKVKLPLKMDPKSFILVAEGGIWLDYTKV